MARLSPSALEQQVGAGTLQPLYVLTGPDFELKARLVSAMVDSLDADLRAFNLDRIHAAESKGEARKQLWSVLDMARMLPMMAPRRFIVVQSAEKIVSALRSKDDGGDGELEAFEGYLNKPEPHVTIVLVFGAAIDKRTKAAKCLDKCAVMVECDPLAESGDAEAFVRGEAARGGVRIGPAAVRLLVRLAAGDISRLRAEFEKALLFASGEGIITEAAVEAIASAPTTQDPWAMTNAIERHETAGALRELALKLDAAEMPVMILGQLAWFVRMKLPPARLAGAVEAVFRTDLALKTSRGEPRVLLERLVVELCG
ncbi:MAG: DNA polymerase III subunit delta [Acidobacteriota bacterium]